MRDVRDLIHDEIVIDGTVYMRRYYLGRGRRLRIHEILRSDVGDMHDHPWPFRSKIVEGSYVEITPEGEHEYHAGDVISCRTWGFMTANGWVDHRHYDQTLRMDDGTRL